MRIPLSRKIFWVFLPLTTISLVLGVIVYYGLNGIQQANSQICKLKDFQLQLNELELWQTSMGSHKNVERLEDFKREIFKTKQMAVELVQLNTYLPENLRVRLEKIPFFMDNFSRASLELHNRHETDLRFPEKNSALLTELHGKCSNLVGTVDAPRLSALHNLLLKLPNLQIKIYHDRHIAQLPELKGIKKEMARLVDDKEVLTLIEQFIVNVEVNYLNYLGILDRQGFLHKTSENFFQVTTETIKAVERRNQQTKRLFIRAVIAITLLAIVVNLLCWLYSSRYFRLFLDNQRHAIQALEKSDYDFDLPKLPDDEIGDLTRTMQQLAQGVKESLKQLSDSEHKFRELVENLNEWVWEVDENGRYTFSSPVLQDILGYKPVEVLGKTPFDLMPPDEAEHIKAIFQEYSAAAKPFVGLVNVNLHKDGHPVILETSGQAIIDSHGVFRGYRGVDRDITASEQAKAERQKLEEQLHQSQKMESIGRLAGGVAHDFNNILSVINGYAELCLLEMEEGHPLREKVDIISEAGNRAARLTQQLLAFSRKQIIRQELVDLNREIDDTRKMLGRLLGENIEIEIAHGKDLWPIKADRSQLEQLVLNLAINARDAMPSGGKLLIETVNVVLDEAYMQEHYNITPGDYVMLTISDTGHGMNRETREHIFEPFFTTKENGRGTGLGLATVYGIVKQNSGEIMVYSEPDKGSTFKIYLPRGKEESGEQEVVAPQESKGLSGGAETIMLVEDDETVRRLSVEILAGLGYTVLEAENGEDALHVCQRYHGDIDLLLTDVVMPKMGGAELAEKMKALCPKIKVLYMSGYTENAIVKHGILADGVNFIHKPVTPKFLAKAVRKIFE